MLRELRLLVSALFLAASACARATSGEAAPSPGSVEIAVTNNNALPMEIFAVAQGINHRLGTVHPGMDGHFTLPQNLVGNGSVQFVARPSGGGQPYRSGDILVAPGAFIDFEVAPQLFNSTVDRRS